MANKMTSEQRLDLQRRWSLGETRSEAFAAIAPFDPPEWFRAEFDCLWDLHSIGFTPTVQLSLPLDLLPNPQWVEWLMGYPSGWSDLKR